MDVRIIESSKTFFDYLPYIITILSIISTIILACLQYKASVNTHRKNRSFDTKIEAIQEAFDFLDLYISHIPTYDNRLPSVPNQPLYTPTSDEELTRLGRRAHNKLCITCDNKATVDLFLQIVTPDEIPQPLYEQYYDFRNACREELGFEKLELQKEKIFITKISTHPLD